jgi:hypothetical protein
MIDVTRVGMRDRPVSLLRARMSRNEHHRTPLRYAGRKTAMGSFSCRRLVQRVVNDVDGEGQAHRPSGDLGVRQD